jgi:phosphodiesterase/alkaline phosphatase D-like protein
MRNKWRGNSKIQNNRREREHPPIDAETFEEWRTNFMKEQTDEGRKDECGNIRPSPEIGRT